MSSSGLASSGTMSAIFPFSMVPRECSWPRNSAGFAVAACMASMGVKPASTKQSKFIVKIDAWNKRPIREIGSHHDLNAGLMHCLNQFDVFQMDGPALLSRLHRRSQEKPPIIMRVGTDQVPFLTNRAKSLRRKLPQLLSLWASARQRGRPCL